MTDRQTDRQKDASSFIICPCYAIAVTVVQIILGPELQCYILVALSFYDNSTMVKFCGVAKVSWV